MMDLLPLLTVMLMEMLMLMGILPLMLMLTTILREAAVLRITFYPPDGKSGLTDRCTGTVSTY
jgi:hypothetical protein